MIYHHSYQIAFIYTTLERQIYIVIKHVHVR